MEQTQTPEEIKRAKRREYMRKYNADKKNREAKRDRDNNRYKAAKEGTPIEKKRAGRPRKTQGTPPTPPCPPCPPCPPPVPCDCTKKRGRGQVTTRKKLPSLQLDQIKNTLNTHGLGLPSEKKDQSLSDQQQAIRLSKYAKWDTTDLVKGLMRADHNIEAIKLEYVNDNSRLNVIQRICYLINQIPLKLPREIIDKYENTEKEFNAQTKLNKLQQLKNNENADIKIMKVLSLKVFEDKIKTLDRLDLHRILMLMFLEVKCRDDFARLHIVKTAAETKDESKNFMIVPENQKEPITVVLNKFKTSSRYETLTTLLPADLSKDIRYYLAANHLTYGNHAFGGKKTRVLSPQIIRGNMNTFGISSMGINYLRHMVASNAKHLPTAQRAALAEKMGHSFLTHCMTYVVEVQDLEEAKRAQEASPIDEKISDNVEVTEPPKSVTNPVIKEVVGQYINDKGKRVIKVKLKKTVSPSASTGAEQPARNKRGKV